MGDAVAPRLLRVVEGAVGCAQEPRDVGDSVEFEAVAIPKLAVTTRWGQCCDSMAAQSSSAIWSATRHRPREAGRRIPRRRTAATRSPERVLALSVAATSPKDVVAGQVAEFVVVRFEMVDVDRHHRERSENLRSGNNGVDALGQPPAVGETGQRIEVRHLLEAGVLLLELGLDVEDAPGDRQPDDQLFLIHGLGQEVVGSRSQTLQSVEAIGPARHHDDVRVRVPSGRSDPAAKLRTIHIGHHPVRDHQPPILAIDELQGRDARGDQMGLMAETEREFRKGPARAFSDHRRRGFAWLAFQNEIGLE